MKFAIVDSITLKVKITSYSRKIIEGLYESGFKTSCGLFKIVIL